MLLVWLLSRTFFSLATPLATTKQEIFFFIIEKNTKFSFKQLFHSSLYKNISSFGRCKGDKLSLEATTIIWLMFLIYINNMRYGLFSPL